MSKTVLVRDEVGRVFTVLESDALRRGLKVLGDAPADPAIAAEATAEPAVAEETSADPAAEKKSRARSSQSAPNPEGTDR